MSDPILDAIRLQIRRLSQVRVDVDEIYSLLGEEVIKRELIDGDEAKSASAFLKKMQRRLGAKRNEADDDEPAGEQETAATSTPASKSQDSVASAQAAVPPPAGGDKS